MALGAEEVWIRNPNHWILILYRSSSKKKKNENEKRKKRRSRKKKGILLSLLAMDTSPKFADVGVGAVFEITPFSTLFSSSSSSFRFFYKQIWSSSNLRLLFSYAFPPIHASISYLFFSLSSLSFPSFPLLSFPFVQRHTFTSASAGAGMGVRRLSACCALKCVLVLVIVLVTATFFCFWFNRRRGVYEYACLHGRHWRGVLLVSSRAGAWD